MMPHQTQRPLGYGTSDKGECRECGNEFPLRLMDGYVRGHNNCPGGGKPPVKPTDEVTLDLPKPK